MPLNLRSIHPENKVLIKDDKEGPGGLSDYVLETESGRVESGEGGSDRRKGMFVFNTAYTIHRLDPFRMSLSYSDLISTRLGLQCNNVLG